ncbi:MAG: prenyltransferase [Tannerellaceae bacterium]|jgi:1,4-dihydroxy-2-naphthoate octaprenyltransferase|nr:prenyltransferase [Tannerellaceae bacterium]
MIHNISALTTVLQKIPVITGFWWHNARPASLPQSLLPAILGVCIAAGQDAFSLPLALAAVFGVIFAHLATNLWDDYFDYRVKQSGFRDTLARQGFRARILKCPYLTSGQATLNQLLIACIIFSSIALLPCLFIFSFRGIFIFYITLVTGLLGIFYSGYPLRLSYHGLGEIIIGILFGPLLITGVIYAAAGTFLPQSLFLSIPVGLLVMNIVYTHAVIDVTADKVAGKHTLAVVLHQPRLMLAVLFLLLLVPFGIIVYGVTQGLSPWYLLTLGTLPMAGVLFFMVIEFFRTPQRSFEPKFWMGPMRHWATVKAQGIDWFLIRWFVARNLLSFFCILLCAVALLAN